MSFVEVNSAYESWLKSRCDIQQDELDRKHDKKMSKVVFSFLRATFFRWAGEIEAICPELKKAPAVLSVGDTHIENFGTWRDGEGRLVWGVNDFDDASLIPYPFDLVRLATSARVSPQMAVGSAATANAILRGYDRGLANPRPTLLDEQEVWMRPLVACSDVDRADFWAEVDKLPTTKPPKEVARSLKDCLPNGAAIERFCKRTKGAGSLGRRRYVVVAGWRGGRIVREAKALVPSAWDWAHQRAGSKSRFLELANGRFRSPDPFLTVQGGFVLRRIAADARKVELEQGQGARSLRRPLLEAMGFDVGAIHAANKGAAAAIRADLARRPAGWLSKAARAAAAAVAEDFQEWQQYRSD